MELARRTWTDIEDTPPAVALLPVGSVEQHGPHAPLGTDLFIAAEVATRGAAAIDADTAVCPPIPVGVAEEHRSFAGSLWVSPDAFRAYVKETVQSLVSHGVSAIVLVNGHGGNVDALAEVAAAVTREGAARCAAFTWFDSLTDPPYPMGHGGPLETAALLAIDETLIHEDRLESAAAGASDRWGNWAGGTNLSVDVDEFTENGVVGDPSVATAELGEALLEEATANLASMAAALIETADADEDR